MRIPQTISGLLVHLIGDALGFRPAGTSEGKGVERARQRLAEKRKRNQEVYGHLPPAEPSRQVLRAAVRRAFKIERHGRKMAALKGKVPGGAAVVQ
jgi:hypothetical protein